MTQRPPIAPDEPNRRALILPGGGMRVAYQAGAVQALHARGLRFSYADGTSGGLINLAALLSGVAPDDLAAKWRSLRPSAFVSTLPLATYLRPFSLPSLGALDGIRKVVFPHLGVDVGRLNGAGGIAAHFNVCDFTAKAVFAVPHSEVKLPQLLAGVSLPLLTPAVEYQGRSWTDAVWIKDCNLLAAVQAGANELWVIWCIGNTPKYRRGLLHQYVHMIEMAAVGALSSELAEISRLNTRIRAGERPFGHDVPIIVHVVRPDLPIPLDPDFLFGRVSADALVDQGHCDAARYLARAAPAGIELASKATATAEPGCGVSFRETMVGRLSFGAIDPLAADKDVNAVPVRLRATIDIRDVTAFVADAAHQGDMAAHLESPRLGGTLPATATNFQLFAPSDREDQTEMVYECAVDIFGKPHFFSGRKYVLRGPPWRLWRDTTTLHVLLHEGRDTSGPVVAAGVLRLGIFDFLGLLSTFWTRDCLSLRAKLATTLRFATFFLRALWATYVSRSGV